MLERADDHAGIIGQAITYSQYSLYTESTIYISRCIGILNGTPLYAGGKAGLADGFRVYYPLYT
jgi:hypothetical protein